MNKKRVDFYGCEVSSSSIPNSVIGGESSAYSSDLDDLETLDVWPRKRWLMLVPLKWLNILWKFHILLWTTDSNQQFVSFGDVDKEQVTPVTMY